MIKYDSDIPIGPLPLLYSMLVGFRNNHNATLDHASPAQLATIRRLTMNRADGGNDAENTGYERFDIHVLRDGTAIATRDEFTLVYKPESGWRSAPGTAFGAFGDALRSLRDNLADDDE